MHRATGSLPGEGTPGMEGRVSKAQHSSLSTFLPERELPCPHAHPSCLWPSLRPAQCGQDNGPAVCVHTPSSDPSHAFKLLTGQLRGSGHKLGSARQ